MGPPRLRPVRRAGSALRKPWWAPLIATRNVSRDRTTRTTRAASRQSPIRHRPPQTAHRTTRAAVRLRTTSRGPPPIEHRTTHTSRGPPPIEHRTTHVAVRHRGAGQFAGRAASRARGTSDRLAARAHASPQARIERRTGDDASHGVTVHRVGHAGRRPSAGNWGRRSRPQCRSLGDDPHARPAARRLRQVARPRPAARRLRQVARPRLSASAPSSARRTVVPASGRSARAPAA